MCGSRQRPLDPSLTTLGECMCSEKSVLGAVLTTGYLTTGYPVADAS